MNLPNASHPSPSHALNFETITWNGKRYNLTPKQRIIVAILWQAWESGHPFVAGGYLQEQAKSDSRMSALFKQNGCWNTLVAPGGAHRGPTGTYCLTPLTETVQPTPPALEA